MALLVVSVLGLAGTVSLFWGRVQVAEISTNLLIWLLLIVNHLDLGFRWPLGLRVTLRILSVVCFLAAGVSIWNDYQRLEQKKRAFLDEELHLTN